MTRTAEFVERSAKLRRSALWAAYGDALGWISELTDAAGLKRRICHGALSRPVEWKRRVGGRGGIRATLPAGCYSDDSQLRLATGRTISADRFDVEAFAKVELPVWLSYALGAGRGTSAAAANLARPRVPWFGNTFKGWAESGGNGAAMRVQPHVWAASKPSDPDCFLPDVIRNTVCTHSHPVGLVGSVLHALALARTMIEGRQPSLDDLMDLTAVLPDVPAMMGADAETGNYWRAAFEVEAGPFDVAWARVVEDCRDAVRLAAREAAGSPGAAAYAAVVDGLRLRDPKRRGSGMLTAIAAVGVASCEAEPEEAMRIAANALGTDTDTIATMAGAILGVIAQEEPPTEVMDADVFRAEADRLAAIACGGTPRGYQYPDLLHWSAPAGRADALVRTPRGALYVRGLGPAEAVGAPIWSPVGDFAWQWVVVESGQHLLIKHRRSLEQLEEEPNAVPQQPALESTQPRDHELSRAGVEEERARPVDRDGRGARYEPSAGVDAAQGVNLDQALKSMPRYINNDRLVGRTLRRVVAEGTPGEIAAYVLALVDGLKRRNARRER